MESLSAIWEPSKTVSLLKLASSAHVTSQMPVFYIGARHLTGRGPKTMRGGHSSGEERAGSGGHALQCDLGTREMTSDSFFVAGKRFVDTTDSIVNCV